VDWMHCQNSELIITHGIRKARLGVDIFDKRILDSCKSFQFIRRTPALYFLRPKNSLGSWNIVSPLLRIKKACTDECGARLQPLTKTTIRYEQFILNVFCLT